MNTEIILYTQQLLANPKFQELDDYGWKNSSLWIRTVNSITKIPGLSGWIITLHKAIQKKNGKWTHNDKQVVGTTTTNASGFYLFSNLPSGTYIVDQIKVKGWKQTSDDTKVIFGVATSSISVDFSNVVKKANGRDKDKNKDDDKKDNGHRWGWFK